MCPWWGKKKKMKILASLFCLLGIACSEPCLFPKELNLFELEASCAGTPSNPGKYCMSSTKNLKQIFMKNIFLSKKFRPYISLNEPKSVFKQLLRISEIPFKVKFFPGHIVLYKFERITM